VNKSIKAGTQLLSAEAFPFSNDDSSSDLRAVTPRPAELDCSNGELSNGFTQLERPQTRTPQAPGRQALNLLLAQYEEECKRLRAEASEAQRQQTRAEQVRYGIDSVHSLSHTDEGCLCLCR
jgi:hypothetical protein